MLTMMSSDPLLDHLEKTFADAYRKEIDQEENVWRSLPFFAATLALQLAALGQVREWLVGLEGSMLLVTAVLLCAAGVATLAAILFLAFSVWPADFQYVAREPAFRDYAEQVRARAEEENAGDAAAAALRTVKAALVEQYATATDNNRMINQGRARWRTRAGLATLGSVLVVLVLVGLGVVTNLYGHERQSSGGPPTRRERPADPTGNLGSAPVEQRAPTVDGGGSQGVVERPGDGAAGPGTGKGSR